MTPKPQLATPEDTELTATKIPTINIADSRFNRFDDEFIDKWFNEQGKQAIQDYITLHTQRAETKARINEHFELWDIVPSIVEHVGTVKEISDLLVLKLEAQLTNPTEAGEL